MVLRCFSWSAAELATTLTGSIMDLTRLCPLAAVNLLQQIRTVPMPQRTCMIGYVAWFYITKPQYRTLSKRILRPA